MISLLKKITNPKKALGYGVLTATLMGSSIFAEAGSANKTVTVQSSLHTFSTENTITAINTDLTMLIKAKTPQEIEHQKPRKRKRRRRRRIFRRNLKDQ
ncbi:MAG: hypothetical protein P8P81_02790 [Bacteroidia bacterium]|jgi:hypothetical protein|nr:hypothetical protein [Bacteroidia bacterium]